MEDRVRHPIIGMLVYWIVILIWRLYERRLVRRVNMTGAHIQEAVSAIRAELAAPEREALSVSVTSRGVERWN